LKPFITLLLKTILFIFIYLFRLNL